MKQISIFLLSFAFSLSSAWAQGFEIPRHLTSGFSNWTSQSLGDLCFSMQATVEPLSCNPAQFARTPHNGTTYEVHGFAGSNINYLKDVNAIINNTATEENVNRVVNQNRSFELDADLEVAGIQENWAWSVSPTRLNYYSLLRDRALPLISLYAAQETILRAQLAREISHNLFAGLQVRAMNRKFIQSDFFVTDILVEGGAQQVLDVKSQQAVFVEPGIVWAPEDVPLRPQMSLAIAQSGFVSKTFEGLRTAPEAHAGASFHPEVANGDLELGAQISFHNQYEQIGELFRLGGAYLWEQWQLAGSFNEDSQDLGVAYKKSGYRAGLVYDHKRFEVEASRSDRLNTFYFELGAEFE